LLLMPAAMLVVFVLAAIAFDLSVVFLRQRQAHNVAIAAANDAATAALDIDAFRIDGSYELLDAEALRIARDVVARSDIAEDVVAISASADGAAVTVAVRVRAEYVFAQALPSTPDHVELEVRATAVADTS
jgi:hypothetical protein